MFFCFVFALLCIHYHHISYATPGREMARIRGGGGGGWLWKAFRYFFLQIAKLKAELLIAIKALITNNNHGIKIATIQ